MPVGAARTPIEWDDAYNKVLLQGGRNAAESWASANPRPSGGSSGIGSSGGGILVPGPTTSTGGRTTTVQLPPELQASLKPLLPRVGQGFDTADTALQGILKSPGYTPEELAAMGYDPSLIDPQEIIAAATAPIGGAARSATDRLLLGAAARGGFAPGLNATVERIQQEQGRQAAEAARLARIGVSEFNATAQNRAAEVAANAAANAAGARVQGEQFGASQAASNAAQRLPLLLDYPGRTTTETTTQRTELGAPTVTQPVGVGTRPGQIGAMPPKKKALPAFGTPTTQSRPFGL